MNTVLRAFHGTRDIEGIINAGSIQSNSLQSGGSERFYGFKKRRYDVIVESLAAEGRVILNKGDALGSETMNQRLNSFPEAIADLMELWKSRRNEYTELKRSIFVYFTSDLNVARCYSAGTAGATGGVLEADLNLDSIRRGFNFYKNDPHFIEFPKAVPLDLVVNIYVQKSDLGRIGRLIIKRGLGQINLRALGD